MALLQRTLGRVIRVVQAIFSNAVIEIPRIKYKEELPEGRTTGKAEKGLEGAKYHDS